MKVFKLIDFRVLILSLCIGLFFAYVSSPSLDVIVVYPNPDNEDKLLYKDKSDLCHRFQSKEVECPKNSSLIRKYPVQLKKNTS